MNCLWCSYSGFNSKPWPEASFMCESILRKEKNKWLIIPMSIWQQWDMHHTLCAEGLALLSSHGNCKQGTWFGNELIRGHGAEVLTAPPQASSWAPGIFPSPSVDSGPDPKETSLCFLSLKFGKWVPYLIRIEASMSLCLSEPRKSFREPEANKEPRAENFLLVVCTKRKTSF